MKKIFKKNKKNSETKERQKIEESEEKKDEEEKTSTEEIEEISKNQKKIKNKIEDEEFINLELDGRDLIQKKENPFSDICTICNSKITNIKYICLICPDYIICQKCEQIHIHPLLKCKSVQLSSLKSVYVYMNKRNSIIQSFLKNEKDTSVFGLFQDIFSAKYEINLSTACNKITMRPNKTLKIPITLQNLSNNKINCKILQLYMVAKNIKDLKVYNIEIDLEINKREQNDIFLTVESNNHLGEYNFSVELYSIKNIKLKSNDLDFNIIVNDDEEEENLNEMFKEYNNIIVTSKETKMGIKKIMENENIKENPITILQFLKNNDNDVDKTINNLINKNDINKNIL